MAAAESRFQHLLEPIRDLATNWNIDIANELEEYLNELDSVTITFDEGETNLNFAEAALVIQGSACVYSKKVEYLYNLLYQTLDAVMTKKRQIKKKSSLNADGTDADVDALMDAPELMSLDDHIREATNIDLNEKGCGSYQKTRSATLTMRPPVSLLSSNLGGDQKQTPANQFKISACLMHESGALLLEEKEVRGLDHSLSRIQGPRDDMPFGSPRSIWLDASGDRNSMVNGAVASERTDDPDESHVHFDLGDMSDNEMDDNGYVGQQSAAAGSGSSGSVAQLDQDYDDEEDPWAELDPHDTGIVKPRPLQKGKTYRVPRLTPPSREVLLRGVLHKNALHSAISSSILKSSHKTPYWTEFSGVYARHLLDTKRRNRSRNIASADAARQARQQQQKQRGAQRANTEDAFGDMDELSDDDDMGAGFGELDNADPWEMAELPSTEPIALGNDNEDQLVDMTKTYEDLCREHVDAYMQTAAGFLSETKLSQRVAQWQTKLMPALLEEEKREHFDIHECGRNIMTSITEAPEEELTEPDVLDFESAVAGKQRFEVCRLFLASLQLANAGNVEIVPTVFRDDRGEDGKAIMHEGDTDDAVHSSLALRLITQDGPDMNVYRAPSASATATTSTTTTTTSSNSKAMKTEKDENDEEEPVTKVTGRRKRGGGATRKGKRSKLDEPAKPAGRPTRSTRRRPLAANNNN